MQIQKIYSTHIYICISIRLPGETIWWWLGRGGSYKQMKRSTLAPSSKLRVKDIGLDWLRARLKGHWVEAIHFDETKSILRIKSLKEEKEIVFGYKDNVLNFVDLNHTGNNIIGFSSFNGKTMPLNESIESSFDTISIQPEEEPLDVNLNWIDNIALKTQRQRTRKIKSKIENIEKDIKKLNNFDQMYQAAKNLDYLKNESSYRSGRVKIKFDKTMNAHQKADLIYKKAKAFKAAIQIQTQRLEEELKKLDENQGQEVLSKPFALNWKFNPQKRENKDVNSDLKIKYFTTGNFKLAVGLNAQSNDYLRKSWSKKGDLWAHIENITGAHLIIKTDKVPELTDWECFASLLKDYSNYSGLVISIVWTEIQHVKPVKGKAGLVKFTKEKRVTLNYRPEWMNLLSLRSN